MTLYERVTLGAVVFGLIGPLMVAVCFATLTAIITTVNDYQGLGKLVGG
ncbi:hypothetical protein [Burkholderia stagnalis]|nr:hypothetical protein [Burkholderia stagnalis]